MITRSIVALILLFVFAAGQASAQCNSESAGRQGPGAPTFAEFDLDGDGAISSEEYYQARGARMAKRAQEGGKLKNAANMPAFETIDLDSNGSLSPDEFAAHHREHGRHHHGRHE